MDNNEEFKLRASSPVPAVTSSPESPKFPEKLIESADIQEFKQKQRTAFEAYEQELLGMKVELSEVPSSESLVKLYTIQSKGRAYFERSAEIFRQYLKYYSGVTLLKNRADFYYQQQFQRASEWVRKNLAVDYKNTKSGEERQALITSVIPSVLQEEKFQWEVIETQAKINYQVIKSYQEQFKSIRDDILVQLSIIKNLIMLGDLKIDPEAVRAFRVIDASYRPTQVDREEKRDSFEGETSFSEGPYQL